MGIPPVPEEPTVQPTGDPASRDVAFFLELCNDAVLVLDENGIITAVNAQAGQIFGCFSEELLHTAFRSLRTADNIKPLPYVTRPDNLIYEAGFLRRNGTEFQADVSLSTIVENDRKFYVSVLRDLSPREESQRQQRLATAVFENSLQGIMITDPDGRVLAVNRAFEQITGFDVSDVINQVPNLLQSDLQSPDLYVSMRQHIADHGRWQGEIRGQRKNGGGYTAWLSISAIRDERGRITHQVGVFSDISELKQTEEKLKRLTSLYSALSEINQIIARRPDQNELFAKTCQLAVDYGQLNLAWIGVLDKNTGRVSPEAAYGKDEDHVRRLSISIDPDVPSGRSAASRAIRTGEYVVSSTTLHETAGPDRLDFPDRIGLSAAAAFPLRRAGLVFGALTVYAAEEGFFDEELTFLLRRMADDISFALDSFDQEERRRAVETHIAYLARHDTLTGLHRRSALEEALGHKHAEAERRGQSYSIALIDIDHFKVINDSYGHAIGDEVLVQIAELLRTSCRSMDWVGRWGGEEFLCLIPDSDSGVAMQSMERLRERISSSSFDVADRSLRVTISVGVASFPKDGDSVSDLLVKVDAALYRAKQHGGDRLEQAERNPGIFLIGGQIEEALKEHRILPAYQPIVALSNEEIVADEALARLRLEDGEFLEANRFVNAAGHLHQLHRIDDVVIRQAMNRCIGRIQNGNYTHLHFVNASAGLLAHPDRVAGLLTHVKALYENQHLPMGCAKSIVVEITERAMLEDRKAVLRSLQPLVEFGFRIALDDFGSGYSSFLYLSEFPVSFLKLEQHFVNRVTKDPRTAVMVKGIASLARDLGLTTIAEGIEDPDTAAMLRDLGVDWGQGYYFGRPQIE